MANIESSVTLTCAVAVMAKASIPGRTKTRLIPPLSKEQAADLNTAFLRDIADNLSAAQEHASISPWMAYTPQGSESFFRDNLPEQINLLETTAATLGDCLFYATDSFLKSGFLSACLINGDSPTLPIAHLITAVTALSANGNRMVIGPSTDGGYYLIGLKHAHRRLFQDIDWSTERVFEQTMDRAKEIDLPVFMLPTWYDVDDVSSLRTLADEVLYDRPFRKVGNCPSRCEHTRQLMASFMNDDSLVRRIASKAVGSRVA